MMTFEATPALTDDREHIDELVSLGRYCLVAEGPAYDPLTDSLLGLRRLLVEDFATRAEAEDALEDFESTADYRYAVYPDRPSRITRAFHADEPTPF